MTKIKVLRVWTQAVWWLLNSSHHALSTFQLSGSFTVEILKQNLTSERLPNGLSTDEIQRDSTDVKALKYLTKLIEAALVRWCAKIQASTFPHSVKKSKFLLLMYN